MLVQFFVVTRYSKFMRKNSAELDHKRGRVIGYDAENLTNDTREVVGRQYFLFSTQQ